MAEHMADGNREKIRAIFCEVYKKATLPERSRYLDEACGVGTALRAELDSLLETYEKSGDFLEAPVLGFLGTPLSGAALDGEPIGIGLPNAEVGVWGPRLAVPRGGSVRSPGSGAAIRSRS